MSLQQDQTIQQFRKEDEEEEEQFSDSRSDHEIIRKKDPRNHTSSHLHSELVKQSQFRKCIPMKQRAGNWFYNTFRCSDPTSSYVDKLNQLQINHPAQLNEDYKRMLKDKILKVKILQTSRLELDSNVIHPFVKVHVIDKNNGCYIGKNHEQSEPIVYHNQSITFYDTVTRKYDTSQNNMVLPFATTMCDFRKMGNSIGKWNQKFYINYPTDKLINPDTVFLFEILDFNHQALMYKDTENYDKDNFYRIAWGYLRPVGMGKTHLGISKIQLYRYKFNNKKAQGDFSRSFIPSVYYDFLWSNHEKYEGFLSVQLIYTPAIKYKFVEEGDHPQSLFQDYRPDPTFLKRHYRENQGTGEEIEKKNQNLLRFYRNQNQCEVPQQLVYKLQSSKLGCFRSLFIGNYLFAACPSKKHTSIKVFSMQKGEKVMTLKGHRQMIYSLKTTHNQKYLISSGSDHIARIWQVPNSYGQYIDEDESQRYLRGECVHSAAVYCTSSIHTPINNKLYLVTCCYDGYIRLWDVDLSTHQTEIIKQFLINTYERSPSKVYPTASVVSQSNYFIIGDSIGDVRIYDFSRETLNLRCHMAPQQLKNDVVLCIKILNKNNILIQASDNLFWHFQLSGNRLKMVQKFSGAQFQSKFCDCAVSPDNKYLLSPSQTGKPFMWDLFTGIPVSLDHLNLQIKGPLVTCSWHPQYNLIAFGGFVQLCPIMVYGNILTESQQKLIAAQIQ